MVRLARLRPSNKARAAYSRRRSTFAPMHDWRVASAAPMRRLTLPPTVRGALGAREAAEGRCTYLLKPFDRCTAAATPPGARAKGQRARSAHRAPLAKRRVCAAARRRAVGASARGAGYGTH